MAKKLIKVPKQLAGIRIPKSFRKGAVGTFLGSPAGQLVVAECLLLIGGALAAAASPDSTPGKAVRGAVARGKRALHSASEGAAASGASLLERSGRLATAFEQATEAFRSSLAKHHADADSAIADDVEPGLKDVTPEASGKKKPASSKTVPH